MLPAGRRASLLARPTANNLLLDREQPSFTFDPLGRPHGAFYQGRNYRRSLGNRVLAKFVSRLSAAPTDSGRVPGLALWVLADGRNNAWRLFR